jgi:hypothetical protein
MYFKLSSNSATSLSSSKVLLLLDNFPSSLAVILSYSSSTAPFHTGLPASIIFPPNLDRMSK